MSDSPLTTEMYADNERSLKVLVRHINLNVSRFSLVFVRCNYYHLREQVKNRLQQECPEAEELSLSSNSQTLRIAIEQTLETTQPRALSVYDLSSVKNLDDFLLKINRDRDQFEKQFSFPLILWLTDGIIGKLKRLAPDFYDWGKPPISFSLTSDDLLAFLEQESNDLFAEVVNADVEDLINGNFRKRTLLRQEIEHALQDLQDYEYTLESELAARVYFALAEDDYQQDKIEVAIENCQKSLAYWQENNNLERQGVLSFYLGLCNLRQAELNRAESDACWQEADTYFRQSLEILSGGEFRELKAKFIGYYGEVLKSLKRWEALKKLVQESLELHRVDNNLLELARDYGFLAEIALNHHQDNSTACAYAQQALKTIEAVPDSEQYRGQYLLSLAQGQKNIGESQQALTTLHQAKDCSNFHLNPQLYIAILENLSKAYFEEKNYQEAFKYKQEQRLIENQYGFRAFIGAASLQSPLQTKKYSESLAAVAQEISVSGRQKDVEELIEQIKEPKLPLTIIHGQLGVGKSSTIKAGLIPSLHHQTHEARDFLPVFIKAYQDWSEKLGAELVKQLKAKQKTSLEKLDSLPEITKQLRKSDSNNLITVLIFDQFEEFFFTYQSSTQRKPFFEFLTKCLDISYVEIIISLREDYLHYLLEWKRHNSLGAIDNDILAKKYLYELRNFSVEDARKIMETLTQRSQFDLEPALINQVVTDLAEEEAEIRPIELQVVGAELQSEKIKTLAQYQQLGENAKKKLVENYLEAVVKDCGEENEKVARTVLYFLTGDSNPRPMRTREEIEEDLKKVENYLSQQTEKLDLVLEIFQKSGLVFLLPDIPADRYQLVHDYLVPFLRSNQPYIDELKAELDEIRRQLKLAELEKEIVEEKQKRAEVNYELSELEKKLVKKNKNTIIRNLSLTILVIITIFSLVLYISQKLYSKELTDQLNEYEDRMSTQVNKNIKLSVKLANIFLYQDENKALLEIIIAAYELNNMYEIQKDKNNLNRDTTENVINTLQKIIKMVTQGKILTNQELEYIEKDISTMKLKDQMKLLKELLKISCRHAPQSFKKDTYCTAN